MPARTAERNDRNIINGRRWVVNGSGRFVDAEADPTWGLSDEIGRLKIADVASDTENARLPVRTPPKLSAAAVAQISDNSPLDSSSSNSSSPHTPDQQIAHSRGASTDSNSHQQASGNSHVVHPPLKNTAEAKERPHSFSGGLSTAELRRLQQVGDSDDRPLQQQQQWVQSNADQLSYPSLTNQIHRPLPQQFSFPNNTQQFNDVDSDDRQLEYFQQRSFGSVPPHIISNQNALLTSPRSQFVQARPEPALNYNRTPRNFALQGPSPLSYGNNHTSHLSLGNTQQLYEMMLPTHGPHDNHPLVTRAQQHNVFRGGHHHSSSEPSAIRDATTLALLTNNMQNFGSGMFQPGMPPPALLYNQYYGTPDLAIQQQMAARLQYTGPYGLAAGAASPGLPIENPVPSPPESVCMQGPSANNRKLGLYKTELCRSWEEKGTCRYGSKCQFAHGEEELRNVSRHPKVTFHFLTYRHRVINVLYCFHSTRQKFAR